MTILGNCLNCQGLVRVPSKAPANSKVRCPLCSESYFLSQILDKSVPELELISDDSPQRPPPASIPRVDQVVAADSNGLEDRETFVVPTQLSKGAQRSHRRSSSSDSSDKSGSRAGESTSPYRRTRRNSSKSRRRRHSSGKRSTTTEMIKVVIGGLLAIPIAYLLVLWIFKQDPLNIGPPVSNVVPFLVPAELRGAESRGPENGAQENRPQVESPAMEADDGENDDDDSDDDPIEVPNVDPDRDQNDANA